EAATCDSRDVTDPTSRRDSAGWIRENLGANEMRQGHVSAGVVAWDKDILLAYGGTHIRTDDVTDVLGRTSNVSVLMDDGGTDSWTELEMIAYGGSPPALFRPGSFAWRNSLFVVCGHTSTPFAVTSRVWRADIQAFEEAPEGLWRPVNWTVPDDSVVNAAPTGMYGHTATMFATDDDDPDE
ncbi:unnamed protein product, partial [Sphacelaria rigidula]